MHTDFDQPFWLFTKSQYIPRATMVTTYTVNLFNTYLLWNNKVLKQILPRPILLKLSESTWSGFKLCNAINCLGCKNTSLSHLSKNKSYIHMIKIIKFHWLMLRNMHINNYKMDDSAKNSHENGNRISKNRLSDTIIT